MLIKRLPNLISRFLGDVSTVILIQMIEHGRDPSYYQWQHGKILSFTPSDTDNIAQIVGYRTP